MVDTLSIHDFLDQIESVLAELSDAENDEIETTEVVNLCMVIAEIMSWGTAYGDPLPTALGVSSPTLNKFVRMKGRVRVSTARKVADRLRTYLRSLDTATLPTRATAPKIVHPRPAPSKTLKFAASEWVAVPPSATIKAKIKALSELLESIMRSLSGTNLPPDQQAITELERKQLVALLETALLMLRAPMVEKGLLERAGVSLKKAAASTAEKQVQEGLGRLAKSPFRKLAGDYKAF